MAHTIKCAHCRETHATVAEVRFCQMETANEIFQCEADARAERANERFFEERGTGLTDAEMYGTGFAAYQLACEEAEERYAYL